VCCTVVPAVNVYLGYTCVPSRSTETDASHDCVTAAVHFIDCCGYDPFPQQECQLPLLPALQGIGASQDRNSDDGQCKIPGHLVQGRLFLSTDGDKCAMVNFGGGGGEQKV